MSCKAYKNGNLKLCKDLRSLIGGALLVAEIYDTASMKKRYERVLLKSGEHKAHGVYLACCPFCAEQIFRA